MCGPSGGRFPVPVSWRRVREALLWDDHTQLPWPVLRHLQRPEAEIPLHPLLYVSKPSKVTPSITSIIHPSIHHALTSGQHCLLAKGYHYFLLLFNTIKMKDLIITKNTLNTIKIFCNNNNTILHIHKIYFLILLK